MSTDRPDHSKELWVEVPLTPSQQESVQRSADRFNKFEPYWAVRPRVEGGKVRSHIACLPFLLGYLDPNETNELDLLRLKRSIFYKLEKSFLDCSPESKIYRMCWQAFDNLSRIETGEFLALLKGSDEPALT